MVRRTECTCGSKEYPTAQYDGHGIFMTYTCSKCEAKKLAQFRPDIFEKYKTDEPIEEDER
jgi:hypothetical protein